MVRGRIPKPTALRVIEGNPGKRALPKSEPKPEAVMPACPKWLSKPARAYWRHLAPQFFTVGLMTRLDAVALATFCHCLARYVEAVEFIDKNGSVIVVRDDKGTFRFTQAAPQVGIAAKMLEQMTRIGSEFGWAPASRSRLTVKSEKEKPLHEIAKERAERVRANEARKRSD